jgi:exonuclease SbcC
LRYQWNSLGKTDTESDNALNVTFETEIEKAFEPCRAFYDVQQKQREQNMLAKQQVLAEIKALGEQDSGVTDLTKTLRSVQQKWKNIGEVDFKQRNALYESYQQLLNPLRDKVSAFYQVNAEQKQALLAKAEKLLELESVNDAVEHAKKLQQVWKTIEHAGKRAEAELWPAFRKVNDSLFATKAEANQQEQTQLKQKVVSVKEQVTQLETLLGSADDKTSVQVALQDKDVVVDAITALPMRERRALEQRIQIVVDQQQLKLTALAKSAKGQVYQDLFSALKLWQTDNEVPECVTSLSKQWQQCFRELGANIERHELTIKMEIVAQQESPKKDAEKRQSIQMQLMAQKLQSGDSVDMLSLLKDWIRAGSLSKRDITLLKRIEPIFVN